MCGIYDVPKVISFDLLAFEVDNIEKENWCNYFVFTRLCFIHSNVEAIRSHYVVLRDNQLE